MVPTAGSAWSYRSPHPVRESDVCRMSSTRAVRELTHRAARAAGAGPRPVRSAPDSAAAATDGGLQSAVRLAGRGGGHHFARHAHGRRTPVAVHRAGQNPPHASHLGGCNQLHAGGGVVGGDTTIAHTAISLCRTCRSIDLRGTLGRGSPAVSCQDHESVNIR